MQDPVGLHGGRQKQMSARIMLLSGVGGKAGRKSKDNTRNSESGSPYAVHSRNIHEKAEGQEINTRKGRGERKRKKTEEKCRRLWLVEKNSILETQQAFPRLIKYQRKKNS